MKKYKKIISLILSLAMVASVSTPVYASETVNEVDNIGIESQLIKSEPEEDIPDIENPETETPETPETEIPENPDIETPENPETEIPENPETEIPENPETEIPENPETEIPETPETETPENPDPEDPEKPEYEEGRLVEDENGIRLVYADGKYAQSEFVDVENITYYFGEDGYMVTGWQLIGNHWYYFLENGEMERGWSYIDSEWYFLYEDDGHLATDEYIGEYYVNASGKWRKDRWVQDSKGWWLELKEGGYAVGWKEVDGTWYFFFKSGYMAVGWGEINGLWYYFKKSGAMASKSWLEYKDKWYYFVKSGAMATGWVNVDGTWYLANSSGELLSGLRKVGGAYYYLDSNYKMRGEGTIHIFGKTLDISSSGSIDLKGSEFIVDEALNVLDSVGWNLRSAYKWPVALKYYRMADNVPEGWYRADWYAHYGFSNNCGNCRVMACTLYYMTQIMGYDSHYVEGYVPRRGGGWAPHGWIEIVHSNGTYVYDPNFENETGLNGYHIKYGQSGTWRYDSYHRVN